MLDGGALPCFGTKLLTWHFSVRVEAEEGEREEVKGDRERERGRALGLETVTSAVPLAPLISTGSPSCPGIS